MTAGRVYRFAEFELDSGQRILQRSGALIPLSPKVVDTLLALVEAAPSIVDKDTLFRRVWPDTHVVESSLTRNMSVLRKALGDEDGGRLIETISKRGYRMVVPVTIVEPARAPSRRRAMRAGVALAVLAGGTSLGWLAWGTKASPDFSEAHREYLIGQHLWNKATPAMLEKALNRFDEAIRLDPRDALSHAGRADALIALATVGSRKPGVAGPAAKQAAERAVELGPRIAAVHAVLGAALLVNDFDWGGAEREYRRAIALDPKGVRAYYGLSRLLAQTGRLAEAVRAIETAQRLDPVSPLIAVRAAYFTYCARDFRKAERQFLAVLEREPDYDAANYYLGLIHGYAGNVDRALDYLGRARLSPATLRNDRAWVLAKNGRPSEAEQLLEQVARLRRDHRAGVSAGTLLLIQLGRLDEAAEGARAAIGDREIWALDLAIDPRFEPLHAHSRFPALLAQLGLRSR